jgi:hypothetical protein
MSSDRAAYERAVRQAEAENRREVEAYNRQVDQFNRQERQRVESDVNAHNRRVEQHNRTEEQRVRENARRVDEHSRRARQQNQRAVSDYNRHVGQVNAHNAATIADLQNRLRVATSGPRYTVDEEALADRIQRAVAPLDDREWDVFLSYARIDGGEAGDALRQQLESLGVRVWFDEIAIQPGKSQARQMDQGLQKARAGIVLLTPAYVAGRFWTERELGALLHKDTLIPVLDGVTFEQVAEYSGILPDLAGFETARDSLEAIAQKIAAAVLTV